jgi:ribosomal protein L37AE/L43A
MQWFESSPPNVCAQCGAALFAAEWAEHLSDRQVRNVWSCDACGYQFETTVYLPAREEVRDEAQQALR